MKFSDVISHFGSQTRVAQALGIAPSSVCLWQQGGEVPILRQHQLERLTLGALRAEDPVLRRAATAVRRNGSRRAGR